jgi:hypothetical protein
LITVRATLPATVKKLSPKHREYLMRVNAKRNERRLDSQDKQLRARGGSGRRRPGSRRKSVPATSDVRIVAPEYFNLEDAVARRQLLRKLRVIRKHAIRGAGVVIDFRATKRMYPSGTLLFLAELDRLRQLTGRRNVRAATYPRDRVVEQVLQQVGILRMVGLRERMQADTFAENVRHWHHATGEFAEGNKLQNLIERYEGRLAPSLTSGLYDGIVEAMTNCVQHAYPREAVGPWRADRIPADVAKGCRSWWMFSQERNGKLTVVFCDLGVGIPVSVKDPAKWPQQALASILGTLRLASPNASLIKAATELYKTRTGRTYRGKGLPDILDVVRTGKSGHLSITSNSGVYRYDAASGNETMYDIGVSIMGTLIQWTIPLPENLS